MVKKIVILGSTGSIGTQALDVIARHPDRFRVVGLVAGRNRRLLSEQIQRFRPKWVAVTEKEDAEALRTVSSETRVFWGDEGICELVESSDADLVVSAIVGAAGLKPTLRALELGKTVALANKESLVIAGEIMTRAAREKKGSLIPIDSEHNAIFQALKGHPKSALKRIILTASGGPFFKKTAEELANVTVEEALKHPKWSMGPKITVDSATLMNKGLEVIEATWLFDVPPSQVEIHVHPESIVHSLVEYCDGSVLAQLGLPDMRCAISYALAHPDRIESGVESLDLLKVGSLNFFPSDPLKFPAIRLAYEAVKKGRSFPAVLNAANEVAVDLFLKRKVKFSQIPVLVERALEKHRPFDVHRIEDVLEADRWARHETNS